MGQIREVLLIPPEKVFVCEKMTFWGMEIEALDNAMQPIFRHGDLLAQSPAEGDQGAEFTHVGGGYPYLRNDIGDQQSDQSFDIFLVSFHSSFSDLADFSSVCNNSFRNQGCDNIIDVPDIGSGFNHDSVAWFQVFVSPITEARHLNTSGAKGPLLLIVHATDEDIFFVEIDGDEAMDGDCFGAKNHDTLQI